MEDLNYMIYNESGLWAYPSSRGIILLLHCCSEAAGLNVVFHQLHHNQVNTIVRLVLLFVYLGSM